MSNNQWPIGTIVSVTQILESGLQELIAAGMDTIQLRLGDARQQLPENISRLKSFLRSTDPGFCILTAVAGWPPPAVWDFQSGPDTLGLVPEAFREDRMKSLMCSFDLAAELGIPLVQTHFGFVPENPTDTRYSGVVDCLRTLARYAANLGITFCLETGQETPVTLRRLIEDAGEANLGINLDPANLLMYGKGNPSDAVDVFGPWIRSLHIKDGDYPTDMYRLGAEHPVGQGRVDFPGIFRKLAKLGFDGPLIIEREITGPQQMADVFQTVKMLESWMGMIKREEYAKQMADAAKDQGYVDRILETQVAFEHVDNGIVYSGKQVGRGPC